MVSNVGGGRHLSLFTVEVWQWAGLRVSSTDQKLLGDKVCEGVGQVWSEIHPSSSPTAKINLCLWVGWGGVNTCNKIVQ